MGGLRGLRIGMLEGNTDEGLLRWARALEISAASRA